MYNYLIELILMQKNRASIPWIISLIIFLPMLISAQVINPMENHLSYNDSYRIYPSNVTQTEVFITRSPNNENIIFSSCNTLTFIPFFISEGVYVSNDGGNNWDGNDSCMGEPISFHGGDPGIAIDKTGRFIMTRLGRSPFLGLYSHFSWDNGISWSSQIAISNDDLERASLISDVSDKSNNNGRTYTSWVKFAPPYPVMLSYVDSENTNWSQPTQINNPTSRCAGGDNAVNSEGTIFTCWAGVTNSSPFKEKFVGIASSSDGGIVWNTQENAFEVNGITGLLPNKGNIRVNGLPGIDIDKSEGERDGWIYVVTGQKDLAPAGSDPDIILNISSDNGLTWSDGIRVNQDELNNGKVQYFPTVHIDDYGAINIIYYDDRNTTSDSTGVFLSRSTDGGVSWNEYEISDHNFKPNAIGGLGQGYQGDNIDITSTSTQLLPVWMDNSTGIYQIWTSPISFTDLDHIDNLHKPFFYLNQNFPNPFNQSTTISYGVYSETELKISIIDNYGNEIIIVNDRHLPGQYELKLSRKELNLGQGFYIIKMTSGKNIITRKMLLIN